MCTGDAKTTADCFSSVGGEGGRMNLAGAQWMTEAAERTMWLQGQVPVPKKSETVGESCAASIRMVADLIRHLCVGAVSVQTPLIATAGGAFMSILPCFLTNRSLNFKE